AGGAELPQGRARAGPPGPGFILPGGAPAVFVAVALISPVIHPALPASPTPRAFSPTIPASAPASRETAPTPMTTGQATEMPTGLPSPTDLPQEGVPTATADTATPPATAATGEVAAPTPTE